MSIRQMLAAPVDWLIVWVFTVLHRFVFDEWNIISRTKQKTWDPKGKMSINQLPADKIIFPKVFHRDISVMNPGHCHMQLAPSQQKCIVRQPQSWWMQLWRETQCQDPPSWMIKEGSMVCQVCQVCDHLEFWWDIALNFDADGTFQSEISCRIKHEKMSPKTSFECWGHHSTQTNKYIKYSSWFPGSYPTHNNKAPPGSLKDCNWPRRSASVARKSWSFVAPSGHNTWHHSDNL